MQKKIKFLLILFVITFLAACESFQRRTETAPAPTTGPVTPTTPSPETGGSAHVVGGDEVVAQPVTKGTAPKLGVIFGPGALRAYAHIGVLQELSKLKAPIVAVSGLEMGALIAGIYANKGQLYDVEWQMMKLKEEDLLKKGFLDSTVKSGDVRELSGFLDMVFGNAKAEDGRVSFACPALNMSKSQVFMMNRGAFKQMTPYCLAFPPLFKPFQGSVAGVLDLKAAVDFARQKGANYVIYVDLLEGSFQVGPSDSEVNTLWNLTAQALERQAKGVDMVISVPLKDFNLFDFSKRREILQRGLQSGQKAAQKITDKFDL